MSKRWKETEREVASRIGGVRVPITGRTRGDVPDVSHPYFSIEVKDRQVLPSWMMDAMAQARAANKTNKIPIAVFHMKGMKHEDDIVMISLKDLIAMYQDIKPEESNG